MNGASLSSPSCVDKQSRNKPTHATSRYSSANEQTNDISLRNLAAKYNGENPAETAARAAAETAARALEGAARAAEQEQRLQQPASQAKPAGLPFPQVRVLIPLLNSPSPSSGRLTISLPSLPLPASHLVDGGEP